MWKHLCGSTWGGGVSGNTGRRAGSLWTFNFPLLTFLLVRKQQVYRKYLLNRIEAPLFNEHL